MKMKRYCEEVLKDFIKRDLVKLYKKGGHILFDMSAFTPSFKRGMYSEGFKLYVGEGVTMYHVVKDVVSFSKDGNILTFNAKQFSSIL